MATFKRVDGDYSIVSINPTDSVTLDTSLLNITGNLVVGGNASIGNVNLEDVTIDDITANTANVTGTITAGYFVGDGSALSNVSAGVTFANVVKYSSLANSQITAPTPSGNILVAINGVTKVAKFTQQGVEAMMFMGPVTGDLFGSVLKEDSTMLVDANTETHYGTFVGDLIGNVAGNITGNIVGNIVGNIDGNLSSAGTLVISAGGDIQLVPAGNVVISNGTVTNLPAPSFATDAATKLYVDTAVSTGLTIHTPVRLQSPISVGSFTSTYVQGGTTHTVTDIVTGNTLVMSSAHSLSVNDVLWFTNSFNGITGNLAYLIFSTPAANSVTLSSEFDGVQITGLTNGTGLTQPVRANPGVGATLTNASANAALLIDGVSVNTNDRILIYNQTNGYENGVYVVTDPGNVSARWVLTRSTDTDTYAPFDVNALDVGDYFYVSAGNTGAGQSYVMTSPVGPFIHGYSNLTFTQFSSAQIYSAGTGLDLTGTTFSVNAVQSLTSVSTSGNVTATGNVSGGNIITTGQVVATGNVVATANITGGNLTTTGVVTATGNITGGNLITAGVVTATGNVSGNFFIGNGSQLTGIATGTPNAIANGTSNVWASSSGGNIAVTIGGTANVAVFTTTGVTLGVGNVSTGNIINTNSNGVGNIGSSTTYFNTVFAKATSAQYADVAELYRADAYYAPGTVLQFGGEQEVTKCLAPDCSAVAGVVSEAPAYLMNSGLEHEHAVALALLGRVKCLVQAPVAKGDLLVSAGDGAARTNNQANVGTVIGKSLENATRDGLVEIVVGKH